MKYISFPLPLLALLFVAIVVITCCAGYAIESSDIASAVTDRETQMDIADTLANNQPTPTDINYSFADRTSGRHPHPETCRVYYPMGPHSRQRVEIQHPEADDITNYDTRKVVEDTCRSMVASYTSDKMTYDQYKDSDIAEQRSWAEQARMRANKTAASYNEYVLKNSFVWSDNVPDDIVNSLPYL